MTEGRIATGVGGQTEDRAPLEMPIDEEFRVASLSLGWDEDAERVLIEASGPGDQSDGVDSDDGVDGDDDSWLGTHDGDDGPDTLRVQLTPQQARAFSIRAAAVVSAGRPACPFCSLPLDPDARIALRAMADGDGRHVLALAEDIFSLAPAGATLDTADLAKLVQRRAPVYDKDREGHYNLISAVHKSLRGSDPDAALYWVARMLDGGEDPIYILRRLTRFAAEDVGLADPQALPLAISACASRSPAPGSATCRSPPWRRPPPPCARGYASAPAG